jgi:DHA3 family macrolide efflux protein-like MFS transporter
MLGSMIVGFVITYFLTIETGSVVILSISTFLMFIPQIVVTPLSGVLADRWNRKTIIAISDSLQALVTFFLFALFLTGIQNVWLILGINTLRAGLFAFQMPAVQSIIPTMIPKDRLSRINGMNFLFRGLIFSLGPVIAATLLSFFAVEHIFLLDIFTFLIAIVPLLLIKIPSVHQITEEATKKSVFKDFKTGLLVIKMVPGLLAMIIFAMIWNFIMRPWNVLLPYFILNTHEGTALNLALIMTSFSVGSITGSLITTIKKDFKHKIKINIIGASLFFVGQIFAILAPTGNFIIMMIALFPGAVVFPITVSTYLAILQSSVPKDKVGRIMSIDHMISMAIAPIGALISGPLANLFGIVNLLLMCAFIGLLYPIFIWYFTKIKHLEYIEEKVEEVLEEKELVEIAELIE